MLGNSETLLVESGYGYCACSGFLSLQTTSAARTNRRGTHAYRQRNYPGSLSALGHDARELRCVRETAWLIPTQ